MQVITFLGTAVFCRFHVICNCSLFVKMKRPVGAQNLPRVGPRAALHGCNCSLSPLLVWLLSFLLTYPPDTYPALPSLFPLYLWGADLRLDYCDSLLTSFPSTSIPLTPSLPSHLAYRQLITTSPSELLWYLLCFHKYSASSKG